MRDDRAVPAPPRPEGAHRGWWDRPSFPVVAYVAVAVALLLLQYLSARALRDPGWSPWPLGDVRHYLGSWSQFDSHEYLAIAAEGYWYIPGERSPIVWFPLYPLLIRGATGPVGDPLLAGVLLSLAAGLAAAVLYWRWLGVQGSSGRAKLVAFAVLALYPYGWFLYGVVHADSLFLALVLGSFLLVEGRRPVLAGLVGALATAARPTGMALLPALLVLNLQREGVLVVPDGARGLVARLALPMQFVRERLSPRAFAPLLALAGIGSYMAYLGARFGDPLAFSTNQRVYHPGAMPLLKLEALSRWWNFGDDPVYATTIAGQALVALIVVVSVPAVARRFGFGYALFAAVLVAIPTVSTENFMGTGRYLIAAFPVAALLGERLAAHRRWEGPVLAGCATLLIVMTMAFARSEYLT